MAKADLTCEQLRAALDYNAETGEFRWKIKRYRSEIGSVAGGLHGGGYASIGLYGGRYAAHRLAWLYVHGNWPIGQIDHLNGDRSDNRLCNLRDVSQQTNLQNRRIVRKDSVTGILGAYVDRRTGRFNSKIMVDGKYIWLGGFATAEEANAAFIEAKRKHHAGCTI